MQLTDTLAIAASGMQAQGDRLRIVAENIANADATSTDSSGSPYRRKVVTFQSVMDKQTGAELVHVGKRTYDKSDFTKKFDPSSPAADDKGYVQTSNVNPIVEMMDMREARRAYEANLNVVEVSRSMLSQTIDMLK